ncbi:MAG: hypothetical protein GY845_03325 [Planctomycetes bacterium]|nr:hypothetical protein [Planctomycetota bacterium]
MLTKLDHSVNEVDPYAEESIDPIDDELAYQEVIESIAIQIIKKRDLAVAFRAASGIEKRWREDEALFEGTLDSMLGKTDMLDYATGTAPARLSNQPARSMIEINIVRNKCETAEGRFSDIMLPVDSKNWALKVTPVPQITKALKDNRPAFDAASGQPVADPEGQQLSMADVARQDFERASDAMSLMEKEIEDQLTECNYNAELRKLIKASCRLGTGIIKGPNVIKRTRSSYQQKTDDTNGSSVHVFTTVEEERPASEAVSCWNIYPDPDTTEDVKKTMGHIFEKGNIRSKELFDLIGIPGYDEKQIRLVLAEPPKKTVVEPDKSNKKLQAKQIACTDGGLYEIWYYYGDLNRDDLEALGIDISETPEALMLSVAIVLVNDRPIKVMLNPLDSGDLPYDFFQWTQVADSPWGIGLSRMMCWIQRMINGAMRAMMDNAGDSSGVNVIIGGGLSPVDKKLELTGKKLWRYIGEDPEEIDVRKLFTQFQVANNQPELENIINLAFKFLDLETGVPMIFQGEQQRMPETLGATNIMVDASNVSLRSRVKIFDDQITDPHLTKYYHYNMQYNENESIKGDYAVDARGVSALYQREQYIQTLMQILPFKNDPDFSLRVDWDKALKEMFSSLGLNILKSETDYQEALKKAQQTQPPPDPKLQVEELRAESDMAELQAKDQSAQADRQAKAQENQLDRDHAIQLAAIQRDIKIMDFASRENISLSKVKAELSKTTMGLKTQIALSKDSAETKPAPQVVTPPTEPPGRAADGRAYQD